MKLLSLALFVAAALAGQDQCARCHPHEVATFRSSAMGSSIGDPSAQPAGTVYHKLSGTTIDIVRHGAEMRHRIERRGVSAEYPVSYAVGAGKVGYSYIVRLGAYLFQSPVSYYTQTKTWDLTPGYESEKHLDFTHPIVDGCLFCHTGAVRHVAGADDQYAEPAFTPISCERCHGPSAKHLENPVAGSIVNPAKLPARARDSVCEQCHLEGEARILNPAKTWRDFQPGNELESVFVTYLRRGGAPADGSLRAVSQSEQLAQSRCARASGGKLWCGSCHDPHRAPGNRATEVRQVCLSCHAALFASVRHKAAEECVSCHMPRLRPTDVAHSSLTDHRIVRTPEAPKGHTAHDPAPSSDLIAWREPPPAVATRDLGLAYFQVGVGGHSVEDLARSYEILRRLAAASEPDPDVLASLGSLLVEQKHPALAIPLFTRATALAPHNARYAYCLGAALAEAGNPSEAIAELRKSIALDPSVPDPYLKLADLYGRNGQKALRQQVVRDYLKFMPQNMALRAGE